MLHPSKPTITALGVLLPLLALLAGCSLITSELATERALSAAGFTQPDLVVHGGRHGDVVDLRVEPSSRDAPNLAEQASSAARIVWEHLTDRMSSLVVTVGRLGSTTYTRDDLVGLLGPRPAALDARSAGQQDQPAQVAILGVVAVLAVIALGLVARNGRKAR